MFDAITFDAVRAAREYLGALIGTKAAEIIAAVGGVGIKSVQRSVITAPAVYDSTVVLTISAVNPSKTKVNLLGWFGASRVYAALTSPTTVTIYGQDTTWMKASIEVVEWK